MIPTATDLHKLAESYLASFLNLSVSDMLALRDPSCMQIFGPSTVCSSGSANNDDLAEHVKYDMRPIFARFPLAAKEIHVSESGKQVTIWASGQPEFKPEFVDVLSSEELAYTAEFLYALDVNDECKIVRVLEFNDSLVMDRFRTLIENAYRKMSAW